MKTEYYHGYLSASADAVGCLRRADVRGGRGWVYHIDEVDQEVCPLVIRLPHGAFLPGATLGEGMLSRVSLAWGLIDDVSEAWRAASEEALSWATTIQEEALMDELSATCDGCGARVYEDEIEGGLCAECADRAEVVS